MTSTNQPSPPDDATEVRFSIRSLLIWMAVLAVVLSVLGAFIRHFPPDVQFRLATYWGVLAAILCAMIGYVARKRYHAERKAGKIKFRLTPHSYFFPRSPTWGLALAGVACLAYAPTLWILQSFWLAGPQFNWLRAFDLNTIYAIAATGVGISILWWRRVALAENGLIRRKDFIPWSECRRWYWDACYPHVVVIAADRHSAIALRVPPESRDEVAALLNRNFPVKPQAKDVPAEQQAPSVSQRSQEVRWP